MVNPGCVQKVEVTSKAVVEVISKTSEYLQPNPGEQPSGLNAVSLPLDDVDLLPQRPEPSCPC